MATQIQNSFTQFQLTDEEFLAGRLLSTTQVQVIQNLRADKALQRLSINFDPTNPIFFAQQEAEISGAIAVLTQLLDANEDAIAEVMHMRQQQQDEA